MPVYLHVLPKMPSVIDILLFLKVMVPDTLVHLLPSFYSLISCLYLWLQISHALSQEHKMNIFMSTIY